MIREVVAEAQPGHALLGRQGLGGDAAAGPEGVHPGRFPFPLMHIDTGYKFPEMYTFRDEMAASIGARLIVERNEEWIGKGAPSLDPGQRQAPPDAQDPRACSTPKKQHDFDAAFGGARRDEEKSRARKRFFSVRDEFGSGSRRNQRPSCAQPRQRRAGRRRERARVPLSNWTELDVWQYIKSENIPLVPWNSAELVAHHRTGRHHRAGRVPGHRRPDRQAGASPGRRGDAQLPLPQPGLHPLHRGLCPRRPPTSTPSSPRRAAAAAPSAR